MGYCWFTKIDSSVGISVFTGQIKIPGKGMGLKMVDRGLELFEYCSEIGQSVSPTSQFAIAGVF